SPQSQPSHQSANQGSLNPNFSQKEVPWDIVLLNYLAALKVTPGSLLRWGIILTVLGIISSPLSLKSIIRFSFNRKTDLSDRDSSHELEYAESALPKSELVEKAKTHLESIRFQQSYTSGWVGSIKLPVLFETSANQAITISKLQMTFPEIIQKYKQFVSYFLKETKSVLIIGIDELDKLDAEKSKIFLNEIKALFGMENCFYLVSVSEDAMSSFERRGIPFRDAFDSTFDTIIYIDYLTLDEARELIDKRVIGLPKLAFYFIYCFSGGLARDLIRSCRSLLGDLDDSQPESFRKTSILDLCRYMICKDITAKIRSIYIEAKKTTAESTASNFLQATRKLETLIYEERLSSNDLLEICKILKTRVTLQDEKDAAAPLNKEDDLNFKTSLESLQIELTAYLYYMATLFEVFVEKSCVSLLNDSVELTVYMTNLTRARQFFTVNPEFACSLISDFRELQKLECIT
ncbi:MAG: P-loop NTPase fold protein, partial [Thainema sp.]